MLTGSVLRSGFVTAVVGAAATLAASMGMALVGVVAGAAGEKELYLVFTGLAEGALALALLRVTWGIWRGRRAVRSDGARDGRLT